MTGPVTGPADGRERRVCDVVSADLIEGDEATALDVEVSWSGADPWAVSLRFLTGADRHVDWVVGLELLVAGCDGPAGQGDIQLRPAEQAGLLELVLDSPSGHACFGLARGGLVEVLDQITMGGITEQVGPIGGLAGGRDLVAPQLTGWDADIDTEFARLLGEAVDGDAVRGEGA